MKNLSIAIVRMPLFGALLCLLVGCPIDPDGECKEVSCTQGTVWSEDQCRCVEFRNFTATVVRTAPHTEFDFAAEGHNDGDVNDVTLDFLGDTLVLNAHMSTTIIYLELVDTSGANITTGTYTLNSNIMSGWLSHPSWSVSQMIMYGSAGSMTITHIDQGEKTIYATLQFPVGDVSSVVYGEVTEGVLDYNGK